MKYTEEQVKEAIKIIIDNCKERSDCKGCYVHEKYKCNYNDCVLCGDNPVDWYINTHPNNEENKADQIS